jgi:hypothetical protein
MGHSARHVRLVLVRVYHLISSHPLGEIVAMAMAVAVAVMGRKMLPCIQEVQARVQSPESS